MRTVWRRERALGGFAVILAVEESDDGRRFAVGRFVYADGCMMLLTVELDDVRENYDELTILNALEKSRRHDPLSDARALVLGRLPNTVQGI